MSKRTIAWLSGAAVIAAGAGAMWMRPWERMGPASAGAATIGASAPRGGRTVAGTPITLNIEVYEAPFGAEKNEEIIAVTGTGQDGPPRVVRAADVPALRSALTGLIETGQATALTTARTTVRPGQRVTVRVANRPAADVSGGRARDELALVVLAGWSDGGAVSLEAAFQAERVQNSIAVMLEGREARADVTPTLAQHDELVFTQVLAGIRFIVLIRTDKQPAK